MGYPNVAQWRSPPSADFCGEGPSQGRCWKTVHPGDRELQALRNGVCNLDNKRLLLAKRPCLSSRSRIAVIGAGPSLSDDLNWLKLNKNKLIIFAAHSAVRLLQENGISPDFQFALDIDWPDVIADNLQLDTNIPFIVNYQIAPQRIVEFKHILLVAGELISAPAQLHEIVPYMYPTTGNMAFAFAYYCHPAEIYLIGLDFAFRSAEKLHANGSHYDGATDSTEKKVTEKTPVMANFKENKPVFTRGYYDQSRCAIENALAAPTQDVHVYNLSDGALIRGASPKHSSEVKLSVNLMRKTDIVAITSAFEKATNGKHWTPYEITGNVLLEKFKDRLEEVVLLEGLSHKKFATMVDQCQFLVNETCKSCAQDTRMIPYLRVVKDMLVTWYRFMIFAHSVDEMKLIYETGRKALLNSVNEFEWIDSFDTPI